MLSKLLIKGDDDRLRYSEDFADPMKLLAVAERMDPEGVVSKLKLQPCRSGKNADGGR